MHFLIAARIRVKTSPEHAVALQEVDGTQPEACQSGALSQFEFPHFSSKMRPKSSRSPK